jgi:hypothetical protein
MTVLAAAAEPAVQVVRVCEALQDISSYAGNKPKPEGTSVLRVAFNAQTAPKPPQPMIVDEGAVFRKLKQIKASTALRQFRFGSQDYDRWAIVYGRLDPAKPSEPQAQTPAPAKDGLGSSPADLICRGEGVILFLDDSQ